MLESGHTQLSLDTYRAVLTLIIELHCLFRHTPELADYPAAIIGACAVLGKIEDKPPDISSLAATLELPRSTVHRMVQRMVKNGWLRTEQRSDRTLVLIDRPPEDFRGERDLIIERFLKACGSTNE